MGYDYVVCVVVSDGEMKFKPEKASDHHFESEIEFETLEQLCEWVKSNCQIVLSLDHEGNANITIYDDYIE